MIRLETFISNIFTFMFAKNKKNKTSADISNELLQTTKDISAHFFLKKSDLIPLFRSIHKSLATVDTLICVDHIFS